MSDSVTAPEPPQTLFAHVDEFAAYARNSNTHSDEQVELLAKLITEFGWTNPIVKHSQLGIAAGHGRILAAKKIYARGGRIRLPNGYELPVGFVPWIDVSAWSEAQVRAYVMLDNQAGRLSKTDTGLLQSEFELLKEDQPLLVEAFGDLDKPLEEAEPAELAMPETTTVTDTFWMTISGPMEKQAKAMQMMRQLMGLWPDLQLEQGVMRHV